MNISKGNVRVDQVLPTFALVLILFFVAFQSVGKGHFYRKICRIICVFMKNKPPDLVAIKISG